MGIKHPEPHKSIIHKTNHQDGWHHPEKNPTTNFAPDKHRVFCERCIAYNGYCLETGTSRKSRTCNI